MSHSSICNTQKALSHININLKKYRPQCNAKQLLPFKVLKQPFQATSKNSFGIAYISPNSLELNKFKEKLDNFLKQDQINSRITTKIDISKEKQDANLLNQSRLKQSPDRNNKQSSHSLTKRKTIRQCIRHWSLAKNKQKIQEKETHRTIDNESETNFEQVNHSKSILIIKKMSKIKQKIIKSKQQKYEKELYNLNQMPIHNRQQLFFFRQAKIHKTQSNFFNEKDKSIEGQKSISVTGPSILKFSNKEQIQKNSNHPQLNTFNDQLQFIANQKGFSLLRTQQSEPLQNKQALDSSFHESNKHDILKVARLKSKRQKSLPFQKYQQQKFEISPWQRKQNGYDFELF